MLHVVDTPIDHIQVQGLPPGGLAERLRGTHPTRRGVEQLDRLVNGFSAANIPVVEPPIHRIVGDGVHVFVEQAGPPQLPQDSGDTAGPVHVFNVVGAIGGDLRNAGDAVRKLINVGESEINITLLRGGQGVEHRIRGAAHGHVEGHSVTKRILRGDAAGEDGFVFLTIVAATQIHNHFAGLFEQLAAGGVGGQGSTVPRK